MIKLDPAIKNYDWGSRSRLPALLGKEDSKEKIAEMWYGTHPLGMSFVDGEPLRDVLEDKKICFGINKSSDVPILVKLLSAEKALSIQVHPNREEAAVGFERENVAGLPLDSPLRNFKDGNHKPEMIIALSKFEALAGFRDEAKTFELINEIRCPLLWKDVEQASPNSDPPNLLNYESIMTRWYELDNAGIQARVDSLLASRNQRHSPIWVQEVLERTARIHSSYPYDIGVLVSLLLNHVSLEPSEAIYLGANQLHAYLSGIGIEIMACSDNVLRGGLTPKHVDTRELFRITSFESIAEPRQIPLRVGKENWYCPPTDEFYVKNLRLRDGASIDLQEDNASIIVCIAGRLKLGNEFLDPGEAALTFPDEKLQAVACSGDVEVYTSVICNTSS